MSKLIIKDEVKNLPRIDDLEVGEIISIAGVRYLRIERYNPLEGHLTFLCLDALQVVQLRPGTTYNRKISGTLILKDI